MIKQNALLARKVFGPILTKRWLAYLTPIVLLMGIGFYGCLDPAGKYGDRRQCRWCKKEVARISGPLGIKIGARKCEHCGRLKGTGSNGRGRYW